MVRGQAVDHGQSMAGSSRWRKHTHHLQHVDGVMLGRAAYTDPCLMAEVDRALFGASESPPSRLDALDRFEEMSILVPCRRRCLSKFSAQ